MALGGLGSAFGLTALIRRMVSLLLLSNSVPLVAMYLFSRDIFILSYDQLSKFSYAVSPLTFYITWWFIHFVDDFFSLIYNHLGINHYKTSHAFKEVAIIRHPRLGEYAFGFITSTVILHKNTGGEELCCVYVPTNHLYLGDIFLVNSKDIMRPNLSVREGIEIVISGGMAVPKILNKHTGSAIHFISKSWKICSSTNLITHNFDVHP
ncbi:protein LIKE COV 3-like [Nicotiana tabacum]|uniref:Protein LIKE COV 3-like n=1 Tax=Nicotiana tabacum TaxID=4097 RepID=A0A1S4ABW9_TOBAC|nr:PREDICTED: protein LIKE COV 3-like [Nicotiana tabacum]